jgi:hypothetical protein
MRRCHQHLEREIVMIRTGTKTTLLAAAGCLLLAGCGPAKTSATAAGTTSAATSSAAPPAATTGAEPDGASGLTACQLITEQDASAALGTKVGPGTPGGTAALSECIYDGGSLIVGMKADSKAMYDKSHTSAIAKGATEVPGVGDGAFEAGTDHNSTLLCVKGTTLVSIIFGGADAQHEAIAVAKIAVSKL